MMKKLTALISALALLMSLCACSGQAGGAESESASPEPEMSAQPVSEEPISAPPEETEAPEPSEAVQPSADSEASEPAATPEPVPSPEQTSAPTPEPTPAATPEPTPAADPKAIAIELSERRAPVSELYAAIGQPNFSEYGPGCLEPDSEDGELYYDGFTVYTVRTAEREYVYDVM